MSSLRAARGFHLSVVGQYLTYARCMLGSVHTLSALKATPTTGIARRIRVKNGNRVFKSMLGNLWRRAEQNVVETSGKLSRQIAR